MKKILLSVVLILFGITAQLTAQVNGTAARPLVSTAEKPVYYYIENQSATTGYTGNVLLPGTAVGQKLQHLPMPTDVESAKWQLVNEGGIVKLKHKQTGNFMSVSHTYSNTGDIFETNKYEGQSYYKIRSGRQSPTLAYNNNLCDRQRDEDSRLHWYFIVAPESQANYEELLDELTASYYTDFGTYGRSDNARKLNSLSFTAAQNTTLTINQQTVNNTSPVYFDKTTQIIEVVPGSNLSVSFNFTGSWMRNIAYVDWNNDKTFSTADATERIGYNALAGSGNEMTKSITYAVPAGQALGDYRMRIMVDWFDNHSSPNEAKFELLGNGGSVVDVILRVLPAPPSVSFGTSNLIVKGDAFTLTPPTGATVKYTTDNTDPATSPTAVTGTSVTATANFKLRAISVKDGVNSPELVRDIKTIDLTLGNEYYIVFQRTGNTVNPTLALKDMGDGVPMQTQTLQYGQTTQRWTVSKGTSDGLYKLTSIAGNIMYYNGSKFTVSASPAVDAEVDMRFITFSGTSGYTQYSGYEIQRKNSTTMGMNPIGGSAISKEIGEWNNGDGGNAINFMNTKGLLLTEIQKTQAIHDGAITGSEFGQASASSKADLQTVINNAQLDYEKSTSADDLTAITSLQTAVINFNNIITNKNKLISADENKYKWYTIRSTGTATYVANKVISSNGRVLTNKFTFENAGTPVTDAQLFRFEISGSEIIIINKANGYYMATGGAISSTSATFALNLLTDGYSFNIKPASANAIHAQEAGSTIVNWAGDAGSASAWVFDFVKETYAPANITWRGESGNGNWWNKGDNDGDKHWWNLDILQALTRPDIVVWNDTEYTGNNIQFANNVQPAMNVNGAAFKVNSITFDIGASEQRVFIPVDNGSVNFVGLPSSIVNNSTPTHAFNLPVEISGTNLTVNTASGHIAINGVISGAGSLTKTGGHNLYISGANTYAGKTTVSEGKLVVEGNMTLASLEIAEGATLEVASGKQLTVTGAVTNNGTIVLKSDETGTATLVGNVGGKAIVEQAVESSRNYYVGVPIDGAVVPTGIGNKVATFTESTDLWADYAAAGPLTSAVAGQGYLVQVPSTSQLISFSGTLNNGDKSATLSSSMRRFNFLGNPYPSYIDGGVLLNGLTVEQTLWYYSKDASGYTFKTVNAETNISTDNVDKRIAPMQGFWVRANVGTTPTVSFNNTNRMHKPTDGNANIGFRAPQATDYQMLRLQVSNNTLKDVAIVMFSENSTSDWSSSKMMNPSLNVYTLVNGNELAINSNTAIPYDVETTVGLQAPAGEYTISATEFSNFSTDKVYLLDKVTGISTDLSSGGSYTVNLTADYKGTDRFALVFPRTGVPTGLESAAGTTFAFIRNNRVVVNSDALGSIVYVFNGVGQQVASQAITGATTEVSKTLSAGVYVVKVNNDTVKVVVK